MAFTVSTKKLERGVRKLQKTFGVENVLFEMDFIAEQILKRAIEAPIPSDTRLLANSAATAVSRARKKVTFGFNRQYAAFQDAPGRTTPYVIRPKRKRWLYVPITQAGRRHRLGADPKTEGLSFGGFVRSVGGGGGGGGTGGADYILAKEVIVPIKPYGSAIGPNHYFSETLSRNVDFALKALARRLEKKLSDDFPSKGRS